MARLSKCHVLFLVVPSRAVLVYSAVNLEVFFHVMIPTRKYVALIPEVHKSGITYSHKATNPNTTSTVCSITSTGLAEQCCELTILDEIGCFDPQQSFCCRGTFPGLQNFICNSFRRRCFKYITSWNCLSTTSTMRFAKYIIVNINIQFDVQKVSIY